SIVLAICWKPPKSVRRTYKGAASLEDTSMGMDSSWYTTFLQAYFESVVATVLPIWRVFKTEPSGVRQPITPEGNWNETWKQVMEKRQEDQTSRYDCDTSIVYERNPAAQQSAGIQSGVIAHNGSEAAALMLGVGCEEYPSSDLHRASLRRRGGGDAAEEFA